MILKAGLAYAASCFVMFRYPTLLHTPFPDQLKKIRSNDRFYHIAHRGGSWEAVENTRAAFQNAVALGVDILETDVVTTKDGVVVISHDDDIERITGVKGNITDLNFKELPNILGKYKTHFAREEQNFPGEHKFLKLEEFF